MHVLRELKLHSPDDRRLLKMDEGEALFQKGTISTCLRLGSVEKQQLTFRPPRWPRVQSVPINVGSTGNCRKKMVLSLILPTRRPSNRLRNLLERLHSGSMNRLVVGPSACTVSEISLLGSTLWLSGIVDNVSRNLLWRSQE